MLVAQVGEIGSVGVDLVDVFGERILCGGRCDNGCISESVEVLPVHPEKLPSTIDAFARGLFFRTKRQLEVGGSVRGRRHDIVVISVHPGEARSRRAHKCTIVVSVLAMRSKLKLGDCETEVSRSLNEYANQTFLMGEHNRKCTGMAAHNEQSAARISGEFDHCWSFFAMRQREEE
jgi:hypothetical protein